MTPARVVATFVLALAASGCSLFEGDPDLFTGAATSMTEGELRSRIDTFADRFARSMQGAADEVAFLTEDPTVRREALLWKMNVIGECREAAGRPDPRGALSDCWTLCAQLERYFAGGAEERHAFWGQQGALDVALRATEEMGSDVEEIALHWLGRERFERASAQIDAFAAANPMSGRFGRRSYDRPAAAGREFPRVDAIVSAGLAPFNVVGGIDRTAESIREFSDVADRFTKVVEGLPERSRWEAQLALYDFEERPTVIATRRAAEELSASANVLAETARALPEELRGTLAGSFDDVEATSRSLRETAAAVDRTATTARGLVADVETALERSERVVRAAEAASESVARAGAAWEGTIRAVDELRGDERPESESSGGDASEYAPEALGDAADRIGAAAAELRAGLVELRALLDESDVERVTAAVDASTEAALRRTTEHAVDLVDHATKRAAQLAGLVFGLALAFLLVTRRWK